MLETPGKQPEIPEDEREVLRELDLTAAEWMRYRMTHQLPERAEEFMRIRFRAQMEGAKDVQFRRRRQHASDQALREFATVEEYKPSFEDALNKMEDLANRSLAAEITRTNSLFLHLKKAADRYYIQLTTDVDFCARCFEKIKSLMAKLQSILDKQHSIQQEADILECVWILENISISPDDQKSIEVFDELLRNRIQQKRFDVLGKLLSKTSGASQRAFFLFDEAYRKSPSCIEEGSIQDIHSLVTETAGPIVELIAREVTMHGFESTTFESYFLDRMTLASIEAMKESGESDAFRYSFGSLVKSYILALSTQTEHISDGYPSHATAQIFLQTILDLFEAAKKQGEPITPPKELAVFLRKIYAEKVEKYSSGKNRNYLHSWVEDVANIAGLNFKEITKSS